MYWVDAVYKFDASHCYGGDEWSPPFLCHARKRINAASNHTDGVGGVAPLPIQAARMVLVGYVGLCSSSITNHQDCADSAYANETFHDEAMMCFENPDDPHASADGCDEGLGQTSFPLQQFGAGPLRFRVTSTFIDPGPDTTCVGGQCYPSTACVRTIHAFGGAAFKQAAWHPHLRDSSTWIVADSIMEVLYSIALGWGKDSVAVWDSDGSQQTGPRRALTPFQGDSASCAS